ncbi:polycystin-1-like protein 2 isoform X9 [Hydra vulgaris]
MWGVCLGSEWSWSEWGTWSNCSVTCGYGNMSRTRVCLDINFCVGNTIDILSCYGTCTAGLQSSWLDWGSWSNCSSSCGIGAMNRTRVCSGGTKSCIGNNIESINCYNNRSCTGSCVQTTYGGNSNGACCYFPFVFAGRLFYNCTMYGWTAYWCGTTSNYDKDKMWGLCIGWADWSAWSSCGVSCGNGTMSRTRVCLGAVNLCVGNNSEITNCYLNKTCPGLQSSWGSWSAWSSCGVSCGNGTMNRTRVCLGAVNSCFGNSSEIASCYLNKTCPGLQSSWGSWSAWSNCGVSCGNGTMNRTRVCPSAVNSCFGNSSEIASCYLNVTCPGLQSSWGSWSAWSSCGVSCGNGTMNRTRVCPGAVNSCIGNSSEIASCYLNVTCPGLQSSWGSWSAWSSCGVSCGNGTMNRTRVCPGAVNSCIGNSSEIASCYLNVTCPGLQSSWESWSAWSNCGVSCGNGTMNRTRVCPGAVNSCVGNSSEIASCYLNITCPRLQSSWESWSAWSNCGVSCGNGTMNRTRVCPGAVNSCVGNSSEIANCYLNITCPGFESSWGNWIVWSNCDASCGNGTMNRTRVCPGAVNSCVGNSSEIASCYLNVTCPGLQSSWGSWSAWSSCGVSCGNGTMNRTRVCPGAVNSCIGNSSEIASCYLNVTCPVQCKIFSQIKSYFIVPENVYKNTMFDIVFILQNLDVYCFSSSVFKIDASTLSWELELDFGDEISNLGDKKSFINSSFYTFNHSYVECGKYTIQFIIKPCNSIYLFINPEIIDYAIVTVFCVMSSIKIITNPTLETYPYLVLPLKKELALSICQEFGSYIIYTIDWGDDFFQLSDQSQRQSPLAFALSHTYKNVGNYTIIINAKNALQVTSNKIYIQILNCTFPQITFKYGTIENPLQILSVNKDFVAYVDEDSSVCFPSSISIYWILTGNNTISKSQGLLANNKIVYSLRNNLDIGLYNLSLVFTYNMVTVTYISYFMIIDLPFYIEISNGAFCTIAYNQRQGLNISYQNFSISAFVSSGGSQPKIIYQGIIYKWKCRIVSNMLFALNSLAASKMANLSIESNTCFNESWIDLPFNGPELKFSTYMFLEGVTYQFQVVATNLVGKYLQSSFFIQEITFSPGELPNGKIICITNCAEKLNIRDHVIYYFSCLNCDESQLSYIWEVLNDDGEWPEELLQENSTTTGFKNSYLVINVETLLDSKNYTFILKVGYIESPYKALFKIKKQTSSLPHPGTCFVSPQQGYAIITKFKIICQDWTDKENSVLKYQFFYDNGFAEKYTMTTNGDIGYPLLNAKSLDDPMLIDFALGPGNMSKNYSIAILIRVIGIYYAFTKYPDIYIQVFPYEKNVSKVLADISIIDTFIFTSILHAVSYTLNDQSNTLKILNSEAVDNVTGFTNVNDEMVQQKENMVVQLQNVRTNIVDLLHSAPLRDLVDIKDVGDVLATVLYVPEELTLETKTNAVDIITKMSSLLTEESIKSIGPHIYDQITQPFILSISHLFNAIANLNDTVKSIEIEVSTTRAGPLSEQVKNSSESVLKLIQSMDDYFNGLQYYIANNEDPTIGDTPSFRFFVKKFYGDGLKNISSDEYEDELLEENDNEQSGFAIENLTNLLNDSIKYSSLIIKNLNLKNQSFTWDLERSRNIVSETQIIYLSTTNGEKIELKNLTSMINISIKNIPEKMIGQNISLSMPNNVQINFINISSAKCKLMMKFAALNDPQNKTNLIVYIQYGKAPTSDDYDIKLNISTRDGTDLIIGNSTPRSNWSINIQRSQKCKLLKDGSIILWDFHNSTYSFLNKAYLYLSYFYVGPMPEKILESNLYTFDENEFYGAFLYEIKSFCVECNYWNESNNKWMSDGCEVDLLTITFLVTQCKCNHLTAFGGFYVAPNIVPTPTLALLKAGYTLLAVVVSVIFLWVVSLVFARRFDKSDIKKVGVCPLIDNHDEECYLYQITVTTGSRRNAGTKSNIFFKIVGDIGDSGNRRLKDSHRVCFQRSNVDIFIMTTTACLGDLSYMQLWHDNTGGGWYLRDIEVVDLQTEEHFYFMANCWIAVDQDNSSLDLVLPVSGKENVKSFNYLFLSNARKGFTDEHLWLSVVTRLPISNFTRCQRISVSVCLLMTSMTASAMFFEKVPPGSPATENKIGVFTFTTKQLYVGIVCAFITLPVNILLTHLFRMVQPIYQETVVCEPLIKHNQSRFKNLKFENMEDGFSNKLMSQTKKPFYFPHWFLYIAWIICITTILGFGYVILLYGMAFGNKKSFDWLASISLGLIHDIILLQPMKIFLLSILAALASKSIVSKEKFVLYMQGKKLACDENWLHSNKNEETIIERIDEIRMPPPMSLIESMKAARLTELKMQSIAWELLMYFLFSTVVFYLGYISRGSYPYYQTRDVEELFNLKIRPTMTVNKFKVFETLQSSDDFWPWMDSFFLPLLHSEPWFNLSDRYKDNDNMNFPGKVFLPDLMSKVVNGIRIRQVRVKKDSCIMSSKISELFKIPCLSDYKMNVEEVQDFDFDWQKSKMYSSPINPLTIPWRYQTSEELDGYPLSATLEIYSGGGYVIEIFPKWKNKDVVNELKQKKWIDRQTRALIIEFVLFNAATNHFTMVTIVFEIPSFGGMVPYFDVTTFNLYTSTTENSFVTIGLQIIFLLLMFVFTTREFKLLYKKSWSYFHEFWNVIEAVLVVLSILAVVFFFYKVQLVKDLIQRLPKKQPQKFINFQFASYWDTMYTYIVSLLVFFVTLKFIKLLRFNRRVSLLSSTLSVAFFPLSMLGITFVVALCAIISFCTIVFGVLLEGYQTYLGTISSVISLFLGKFSFYTFVKASPVLGPLFFLGFNIFMIWILMNMFISILNDSLACVHLNKDFQNNDYEMLDYFLTRFKAWFGLNTKNYSTNLLPLGLDIAQQRSDNFDYPNAPSRQDSLHLSEIYSMTWFAYEVPYEIVIEQEDDKYMNKMEEKFIDCLHILYKRKFVQAKK